LTVTSFGFELMLRFGLLRDYYKRFMAKLSEDEDQGEEDDLAKGLQTILRVSRFCSV
jgi:hypothetical protein